MSLVKITRAFMKCDAGAITVDWVVITAMVVGLGLAVAIVISSGLGSTSVVIGDTINSAPTAVPLIGGTDDEES